MRKLLIAAVALTAPLMTIACSPSPPPPQTVIVDPPPQRATVAPGQAVVVPPGSTVRTCPAGYTTC